MGGASRFLMLLSAPFPRLYPRPSALRLSSIPLAPLAAAHRSRPPALALFHTSRPRPNFAARAADHIHTQPAARDGLADPPAPPRPWPEWSKLVDHLAAAGYSHRPAIVALGDDDDSFLVHVDLPEDFVAASGTCLSFARDRPDALRLLSKKDLEVVVENGSPFLFKNGANSARRLRSFLSSNKSDSLVSDRAHTIDVMRYLLSYAHNLRNISAGDDNIKSEEFLEASIRNLLNELVNVSGSGRESRPTDFTPIQPFIRQNQFSRAPMQNIEMKRGDWLCPKCNFMNFANNTSCLECKEGRPKRQLHGGEWDCPQCDFFNYGKNMSCIRCDCKRPGETPVSTPTPSSARLGQSEKSSFESSISQSLDRILGRSSSTSGTNDQSVGGNIESRGRFSSAEYRQNVANQRRDGGSVPFVPLPPDMFHKPQETRSEMQKLSEQEDLATDGDRQSSVGEMKNPTESKNGNEELDKSERWFKKVSQLHDSTDLASDISDSDFPEIMPIRKGENRFVISKKKDRSLTSPQYRRRMAMEQANSNFVPFVPFPPDYFAKKDKQPGAGSPVEPSAETLPPFKTNQATSGISSESKFLVSDREATGNVSQQPEITHTNNQKYRPHFSGSSSSNDVFYGGASRSQAQVPNNFLNNNSRESWNDRASQNSTFDGTSAPKSHFQQPGNSQYTRDDQNRGFTGKSLEGSAVTEPSQNSTFDGTSAAKSSFQQPGNSQYTRDNQNRGFTGKSLEGSAVTEPDPLDMSEEAKAQRWFRRVAQIKDISELANIPDEDFPEIMPLRKGVNRFVVSKRKTPLERRLTSQQYRRNLPIVSSESNKDPNSE